ncbi:MAG: 1-acyl-sn-glycerol-3-phosphate acyltransferase, partial [Spirochaetales bacterium]|nr:1-acyl-sn-glycerol-3-phosphate acyltransferase [Spirochaetales bacterium]
MFRIRTENLELVRKQRGAFLILANHSSALDPFLLAAFFRRPVQYVISDSQIRSRLLSFARGLVGVIPKTKVVADLDTVKKIVAVKR